MQEESIYKILDNIKHQEAEVERVQNELEAKRPPKRGQFVLPTASTFINHTTVRPGVCNMGGERDPQAVLQQHKGNHATFGLPKGAAKAQGTTKGLRTTLPPATRFDYADKLGRKPAVPKENEAPLHGLSSNINFIDHNRRKAVSLRPKPAKVETNFLEKKSYGKAPVYLDKIKDTIQKEIEYLNLIHEAETRRPNSKYELPEADKEQLKMALAQRHAEITQEYQKLTHMTKITSEKIRRKKEHCEKQLSQIEKDLQLLGKETIVVNYNC